MVIEIVLAVSGQMIELGLKSYAPIRISAAFPSGRFWIAGHPLTNAALMQQGAPVPQT